MIPCSYSKYAYEYPKRFNDNILVLLQDFYMFRVPAVPIIRSTILQLTVTSMVKCVLTSTLNVIHNRAVCHITVVELSSNHDNVTNRPIMDNF
jgi:hypothetical protein